MTVTYDPMTGDASARLQIEALVGAYPNIADDELAQLLHWLRREATSYDVAMLSAREDIRPGYAQLRKDHIDRISPVAIAMMIAGLLVLVGVTSWFATM